MDQQRLIMDDGSQAARIEFFGSIAISGESFEAKTARPQGIRADGPSNRADVDPVEIAGVAEIRFEIRDRASSIAKGAASLTPILSLSVPTSSWAKTGPQKTRKKRKARTEGVRKGFFWNDFFVAERAFIEHKLTESGEVAQGSVKATAGEWGADGIDGVEGLALSSDAGPDGTGEVVGGGDSGSAGDEPAEDIGGDRFISKGLAVSSFFFSCLKEFEVAARAFVALFAAR